MTGSEIGDGWKSKNCSRRDPSLQLFLCARTVLHPVKGTEVQDVVIYIQAHVGTHVAFGKLFMDGRILSNINIHHKSCVKDLFLYLLVKLMLGFGHGCVVPFLGLFYNMGC